MRLGLHWKPSGTTGCAPGVTPFSTPSQEGGEGEDVSISKKKRKKEGNKNKGQSTFFLSPPDFSTRLSILREKPYSFDHPILPFPYYHIGHGTGRNKIPHGRERKNRVERERETHASLPPFLSQTFSHTGGIKRSHETGKPQSANTPWGPSWISENWKSVNPWDSTTARSHQFSSDIYPPAWNPAEILARRPARNPELTFSLPPPLLSFLYPSLDIIPLPRNHHSALRSAIFAFLDLLVIVRIGSRIKIRIPLRVEEEEEKEEEEYFL